MVPHKRGMVHDEFEEITDPTTGKVSVTCISCRAYSAAKNTTRQTAHLVGCRPYLEKMKEQGIENDITRGIAGKKMAPDGSFITPPPSRPVGRPPGSTTAARAAPLFDGEFDKLDRNLSLKGKVAIVTGASQGIGAGIAMALAERGAKIAITYNSESSTHLASGLIRKIKALNNGSSAISIRADLRLLTAPAFIVSTVTAAFGPHIDILVNNAGISLRKPLGDITPEDYASVFDLNVRAVAFLTQEVIKVLKAPGRIINITSSGARQGGDFAAASLYCASKAAIEGFTRAWATQLGKDGTTVNAVNPPFILTNLTAGLDAEKRQRQADNTPLEKRHGTVDDVAQVVCFIAEEGSRFITGQTINASGGRTMY